MLVSIVVPSRNQGRYLGEALDSVLRQPHRPLEILVVDGASTDGTVALLEDYARRFPEVLWWSEPDDGPADAVNKGLARVRGDIIGILSSDDVYTPGAIAEVVTFFERRPTCGFAYGDVQGVGDRGEPLSRTRHPEFSWEAMFGIALCLPQGSIFFRTEVARAAGFWNPAYFGCDLDYWLRLMMRTQSAKVPRVLSQWRMHPDQRTQARNFTRILRDYRQMISDSDELRLAPAGLRRLAWASCDIMAMDFGAGESNWRRRGYLLRALLRHPTAWRYIPQSKRNTLLPGYAWLRGLLKRLFRRPARDAA